MRTRHSRIIASAEPTTVPRPPLICVPPTTTAVTTSSSKPLPKPGSIVVCCGTLIRAAMATHTPSAVKAAIFKRVADSPASRAACGFEPQA